MGDGKPGDVETFLDAAPHAEESRAMLALFAGATGAAPEMWGSAIVGFGRYRYRYASGTSGTACRVGFSPRKAEFALYGGVGRPEVAALLPGLGRFRTGKGCLYVRRLADVDAAVLRDIVRTAYAAEPEGFIAD